MNAPNISAVGFNEFDSSFLPVSPFPLDFSFELGEVLGSGSFGIVRVCKNKLTGHSFACKSIDKAHLTNPTKREDFIREVRIMRRLAHLPNVVSLHKVFEDDASFHIVMDLCTGGDLASLLKRRGRLGERSCAAVCKAVAEVLRDCHEIGIIHRDVKLGNILLGNTADWSSLKIADFGLATSFSPGEKLTEFTGTLSTMAPEIFDTSAAGYSEEVDVWSLGVVLFLLLSGKPPFKVFKDQRSKRWIRRGDVADAMTTYPWSMISKGARDLTQRMLCTDPSSRITPTEILAHPWVLQLTLPHYRQPDFHAAAISCAQKWPCKIAAKNYSAASPAPITLFAVPDSQ